MEKRHGLDKGLEEIKQPENYEQKIKDKDFSTPTKTQRIIKSTKRNAYKTLSNKSFSNNLNYSQNYEHQLEALENLLSFLNKFKDDLSTRMGQYNEQVFGLRQSGLEEHISDNYDKNFCIPTNSSLFQIIESFEQRDFPFINDNIAKVEEAWEAAKKIH